MSERLFWGRSRRHIVPPLIPLTTYAPSSPTLVTAQQTFPLFVQILWRKKFGCPLLALTTYPASSQFRFLLCFQPDTSFYSHLNFAFNIIHTLTVISKWDKELWNWLFVSSSLSPYLKVVLGWRTRPDFTRPQYFPFCIFDVLPRSPCICIFCSKTEAESDQRKQICKCKEPVFGLLAF